MLNIELDKLLKLTVMEENQRGSCDLYVQPLVVALASSEFCPKKPLNRSRNPITS